MLPSSAAALGLSSLSLPAMGIQKQIDNLKSKLQETQDRRKRQEDLIMKVENLALKVRGLLGSLQICLTLADLENQADLEKPGAFACWVKHSSGVAIPTPEFSLGGKVTCETGGDKGVVVSAPFVAAPFC